MVKHSGNTPLIQNKQLCDRLELPNLWIKDESKNPYDTYKDRRSELILKKALKNKVDKLVLITSGNAGYSLAKYTQHSKIKVVCVVDNGLKKSIKGELKKWGKVVEINLYGKILSSKDIINLAREDKKEVIWDVTNGFEEAYETIVKELKQEKPNFIIVPVGSGEAFVGISQGIKKSKLKTRIIGVEPQKKQYSFADKLCTHWTPYESKIQAILKEGNRLITLEGTEIKKSYNNFKDKFDIEPSSSVVFGALEKLKFKKEDKIILINSGKGIF